MKTDYQNAIVDKVRRLRLSNNYSQQDIALFLGISNGQVGNIETPTKSHKYRLSQLSRICDEFKIRIVDLFLENIDDLTPEELINRLINCIIEYEN